MVVLEKSSLIMQYKKRKFRPQSVRCLNPANPCIAKHKLEDMISWQEVSLQNTGAPAFERDPRSAKENHVIITTLFLSLILLSLNYLPYAMFVLMGLSS